MQPMTIAEPPLIAILRGQRSTGDGLHLVARSYKRGLRLDPHMHREAQLVYAASGTMQVTTPKGRWLVPPDRSVWVPARLEHAIDVLANIEMRTLYFELAWLKRETRCRRAADIVLRAPAAAPEIETLARKVGTSARTLSRLFASETGLSFKS